MRLWTPSYLSALSEIAGIRAGWIERVSGIDVAVEREQAMARLRPDHERAVAEWAGDSPYTWWRAEQVHGTGVALVPGAQTIPYADGHTVVPGVDGLISHTEGTLLSMYVADCGALWLADRRTKAIGLLHSGKKGTEGDILGHAVQRMTHACGSDPADLVVALSPCIRPPHYEVDFAAAIARQAERAGVGNFIDSGEDTASDLSRFYSYRQESGMTGRMMAVLFRTTTP